MLLPLCNYIYHPSRLLLIFISPPPPHLPPPHNHCIHHLATVTASTTSPQLPLLQLLHSHPINHRIHLLPHSPHPYIATVTASIYCHSHRIYICSDCDEVIYAVTVARWYMRWLWRGDRVIHYIQIRFHCSSHLVTVNLLFVYSFISIKKLFKS